MDYVVEAIIAQFERRHQIRGMRITEAPDVLRHFSARFEEVAA
jgi:tryptophanase